MIQRKEPKMSKNKNSMVKPAASGFMMSGMLAVLLSTKSFAADEVIAPAPSGSSVNFILPGIQGPTNLVEAIGLILNVVIGIVALIAVIMIIIGGIRYTTSGGSKDAVTAAKNQIMYAIIGLVIAAFSFAIVTFVTGALNTTTK